MVTQTQVGRGPCHICAGPVEERRVLARFWFRGDTIYIEDVPAWVCKHCGEQYYHAPVYKRMEEIAQEREQIERVISFPLAHYEVKSA